MNDRLFALRLFTRLAQTGSFSKTARELGISQSTASRALAALERELGTALLHRTTRAVSLSSAGADYLARIEPILAALEEADASARSAKEVRGKLRVALPYSLGVRVIVPALPQFLARHPGLTLDVLLDDARHDLVRDDIDVAVRIGVLSGASATARKLGQIPRVLVASPQYLERAGTPTSPSELSRHAVLFGPLSSHAEAWSFRRGDEVVRVQVEARLKLSANEGVVAAARAGLGIASTGRWGCRAELASGALLPLLGDWELRGADVHAVFPAGRATKAGARAFADFLLGALTSGAT